MRGCLRGTSRQATWQGWGRWRESSRRGGTGDKAPEGARADILKRVRCAPRAPAPSSILEEVFKNFSRGILRGMMHWAAITTVQRRAALTPFGVDVETVNTILQVLRLENKCHAFYFCLPSATLLARDVGFISRGRTRGG